MSYYVHWYFDIASPLLYYQEVSVLSEKTYSEVCKKVQSWALVEYDVPAAKGTLKCHLAKKLLDGTM